MIVRRTRALSRSCPISGISTTRAPNPRSSYPNWNRRRQASEKKAEKDELAENDGASPPDTPAAEGSATPVAVPGRYQYVKWWKLLLVLFGAWFAAAEVGLSLFYWWFHTIDKTAPVYVVLVYIVACTVAGLMLSMVEGRPTITALSLGVMSGPFASLAAAAPLYGYYSCARIGNCLFGFIPY